MKESIWFSYLKQKKTKMFPAEAKILRSIFSFDMLSTIDDTVNIIAEEQEAKPRLLRQRICGAVGKRIRLFAGKKASYCGGHQHNRGKSNNKHIAAI